ncbi:MAG: DUF4331 domain-containing protein [Planctomycetota bacterium]|nr:DUF4331 domain-containing protein [Planctomycetota bacterium]
MSRHRIARLSSSLALLALSASAGLAIASSHREAPFITETPKVDATDFYMFNSYEPGREGYVTIIANYQPFQTAYGGPNFFQLDPDALYQIHVDNDGDTREDLTFSFRFNATLDALALNVGGQTVPVPLYNIGAIANLPGGSPNLNIEESYTVDLIRGDRHRGRTTRLTTPGGESRIRKPADNVGAKSFPQGYENYARTFITELVLPGTTQTARVFVGQRKDPFVVNLGEVFDLVNLNPLGPVDGKEDSLAEDNCTSLIIEVPASFLRNGRGETVIGGWTTASLPRNRMLRRSPGFDSPAAEGGPWQQVSRLAMPLVNELVIGLPDKNKFNASEPDDDAQFLVYVTNPTLPVIIQSLFGVQAPCLPRNDLVSVFLTGVEGLNRPACVHPGEMMRLQTDTSRIPVTPIALQSPLGVLGGDLSGFPNGRRPIDDVVDIELRVVAGALYPDAGQPGGCAPGGNLPLTDGAVTSAALYDPFFPYLRTPVASSPQ